MSRDELLVLQKTLIDLLDKGFIRVSNSPAIALVLFVQKAGGGLRFYVNYRQLNKLTRKDYYPLLLIYEILRNLSQARQFTKLDIKATFYKIRIIEGDKQLIAFWTYYGLYKQLVTPFGLINTPSTFQKYINQSLQDYLDEFYLAYINDVLIYMSRSQLDYREKVYKVLQQLQDTRLQLDVDKYEFEVKSTKYLGFIIKVGQGLRIDLAKVKAITSQQPPTSIKAIRSFLGFTNFYQWFIKDFSKVTALLIDLTKRDSSFSQLEAVNAAFLQLKELFTIAPILAQFDLDREMIIETDTSTQSIGNTLFQFDTNGLLQPYIYYSWKNLPMEYNYEIYNKEILAIINYLQEQDTELQSIKEFQIYIDHKNLEYFIIVRKLTKQ